MRNIFAAFLSTQRDRFALFLPVFMGAGILAYFARTSEPDPWWAAATALVMAGCAAALGRWRLLRAPVLCAAFAACGFALACLAAARAPGWSVLPRHATEVAGRVVSVDVLPAGRRVTLSGPELDGGPVLPRGLRIRLRTADPGAVVQGDQIVVRCLLQPPSPPDYPGGWDTQRDAFFAGLGGYGFAVGPVRVLRHAPGGGLVALREAMAARIMRALPGTDGAIAATLLTGIGSAIPAPDRAAFDASGLAHLLAVAGLHVGIVMGLVFHVSRLGLAAWEHAALAWPTRKVAAVAALAAGFVYLVLTGAHVPILRSFGMAALVTLGVLTGRRAISLRGLALAATVLMVASPEAIMGVSFQMSFSAVLCLIVGYEVAQPWLLRLGGVSAWRRPLLYGAGLVLSSVLAGTASAPFAAYHFGRAGLYYVPANMLAVPLAAFWVMPWGLVSLALMPLGLERWALVPMGWGVDVLVAVARRVAGWPAATVAVAQAPAWSMALFFAGLVLGGLLRGRLRLVGLAPALAGLLAAVLAPAPDVLVAPGARLIALRVDGRVFIETARAASAYEKQAPARVWGGAAVAGLACDASLCRTRDVILLRAAERVVCDAKVVVSSMWLHDACPRAVVIDHAFVEREGATAVRLGSDAPRLVTDHGVRGERPWVIGQPTALPMALTE